MYAGHIANVVRATNRLSTSEPIYQSPASTRPAIFLTDAAIASITQTTFMGFLSRKKDKAPGDDVSITKKTKKGKKGQQEEVTPDFDLGSALPSTDDFRTSLIMPGLSTRFSMLREQDDPSSKIGKASDDSVLTPKRSSRLHEFGFAPGGLSDIAEVSSLSGSIRPPFAIERTNSFDSDKTGDESGNMMSRARPGEGNVLFGGRQKIYMISNNSSSKGPGRTLYDDDVNMSAYQRLRAEEKERLRQEAEALNDQHSEPSSPTTLSQKRETSSSTNSGPENTRTSTAATSIASQGVSDAPVTSPALPPSAGPFPTADLNRSTTKGRRLYDQGLDQHIQEQQSSAMNRLNSIQRARAPTGRSTPPIPLSQTRSATSLNDRFHRGPMFRSDSPNALGHPGVVRNNSQLSSGGSSPVVPQIQSPPPASPVISDHEEKQPLTAALQQGDRGKATAMGAFNKPKEAFSEQQYAERLRRMQSEREAPREVPGFPAPVMEPVPNSEKSPPRKPTLRERAEQERRKRAESVGRPRSESSASSTEPSQATSGVSVFQAAASRMKAAANAAQAQPSTEAAQLPQQQKSPDQPMGATFFTAQDSSDDEEPALTRPTTARTVEAARRFENLPIATGPAPPIFEHPAMRSRNVSEEHVPQAASQGPSPMLPQGLSPKPDQVADGGIDSPTLGPNNGGLSGLIRQHLRSDSNVSSNYGETDQHTAAPTSAAPVGLAIQTQDIGLQSRQPGSDSATPAPSNYSHSNPWDLDDLDNPYRNDRGSFSSGSPVDGQRMQPNNNAGLSQQWESRRNHERIASNETEAEHEAFQRDLAQRQRLIQENLRARAEGRSTSPAPGPSGGLKNALNMLRAKSSRESFAVVERQQPDVLHKGLRKMTLGTGSGNASTTSLVGSYIGEHWKAEMPSLKSKSSRLGQQNEDDSQRGLESRQRSGTDSSRMGRPVGRSPPMTSRSSTRERSGSGTSSGRSRSRAGQYREDVENAYPLPTDRPSVDSQGRTRSRSNSYFESKHLHPIQTNTSHPPLPVPSGIPQPKYSPGMPISPRPSPGGYNSPSMNAYQPQASPVPPFSANHTPPTSNPTTPNATAFNPGAVQPLIRQGMLRKKSIAKSEISEPVFVSTTSVIDTVNLPAGASLKNGSEPYVPPPVPPINPKRRRFGFGRSDSEKSSDGPTSHSDLDAPRAPYAEPARTNSSDAGSQIPQPRNYLRKSSSESKSLHSMAQGQTGAVPAMPPTSFLGRNNSAPRPINEQPIAQQNMDGAMF
ncbi:hypothetical protein BU25DRAFT_444276 [Macroventuria anomochaeta]|uniref:Uncharacterized protein n=1 Tax=Macroventuria anomochaeta TaxID=301207 RepID=A0ACB6SHR5_9PLEO|nr:uncharacterized protein BU25DRAFT_444276 [Macroventuria anomochaeta]KAF2633574.1 hypothetical protein BU25DRAFT_444276 [Macroventuria anomochaeta]